MSKLFHITAAFDRGFKKLKLREKDEAFELVSELRAWPDIPRGRNKEKLYEHEDGPVYSLRVNDSLRMIVQLLEDSTFLLRAIGTHDEVYRD
jgi:mRNA-degrading endonuclease RelE of RelBE toxin-antitoxin system